MPQQTTWPASSMELQPLHSSCLAFQSLFQMQGFIPDIHVLKLFLSFIMTGEK